MKKRIIAVAILSSLGHSVAKAQSQSVRLQVFSTLGHTFPTKPYPISNSFNLGLAVRIPLGKREFLRPYFSIGTIRPQVSQPVYTPTLQFGAMVGTRINTHLSIAAGGGATLLFPKTRPSVSLPTATIAAGWRFSKHWSLFAPVSRNSRGTTTAVQGIYTF
jgi:hypothetical protein